MAHAQDNAINWEPIVDVAPSEFGLTNLRMELDAQGHPVILHGKSGSSGGLYCTRWNGSGFDAPVAVTSEAGIFINDSEGPRMAASGDRIVVAYQLSGQWDDGGRVVISDDGGMTWGAPIAHAPGATEDHFMPVPALDEDLQPWVAVKWGTAPALEGVQFWDAANAAFLPAVDAGAPMAGDAACECCASFPFTHDGRHYDIVRNNNGNIRDFWMVRTDADGAWTETLDIDPTDWLINSCPASEAEACVLGDGSLVAVYMSGADGGSRTYWSVVDLDGWSLSGSDRLQPGADHVENNPSVDADGAASVVAWERNVGGYDIVVATGGNAAAAPEQWAASATVVTEDLSGHSRRPVIRISGNTVHLVYQRPSSGTLHYRQGTLTTAGLAASSPAGMPRLLRSVHGWQVQGAGLPFHWQVFDVRGRCVQEDWTSDGHIPFRDKGFHILTFESAGQQRRFSLIR